MTVPAGMVVRTLAVWAQTQPATPSAGGISQPPGPAPLAQWTITAWVGVGVYVAVFLLAAWFIYRLADIKDEGPA